jgi:hypothetical protein
MKISLTHSDLHPQKTAKHLPGETHPFVPKKGSFRNLVPPQQLVGGTIVSGREHEVGRTDPLMQRIRELEAEVATLRQQEAEARVTEMALVHACHLIHQRHACLSGSLEMSEIDEELGKLGLEVWTWSRT